MSKIKGAFIFPHPPIIIKEVGKGQEQAAQETIQAAKQASARIAELKPETIVLITPHGNLFSDAIAISGDETLQGSFASFGAPEVRIELHNDLELLKKIIFFSKQKNLSVIPLDKEIKTAYGLKNELDHGAMVPLYFILQEYKDFKLLHITYSMLSHEEHYSFGETVRQAIESLDRNAVILCSGDLSHRLTKDAPAGYSPKGASFDAEYVDIIKQGDAARLLNLDCQLSESAGECGLRATVILFGMLDGCELQGEILSYEGPFGVGYCVAQLHAKCQENTAKQSSVLEEYRYVKKEQLKHRRSQEGPYTALARYTLEAYIKEGKKPLLPQELPHELLRAKAGVFVSIKKHGELRGCIGTISPTTSSVAEEIMQNAVSAGTKDPRFYPVEEKELEELQYSVDVLMSPEPINSPEELDVKRYGVIVRSGYKSGLLLPNLEGVDTIEEQLNIVLQKAGIAKGESYKLERFEVVRHK